MPGTALITGGSRGIGYATAELFAHKGWCVALCSRNRDEAENAAQRIIDATKNENVIGIGADVGHARAVERMFEQVDKQFGALNALVNNAGILRKGSFLDLTDDDVDEMMRINFTGVLNCCRQAFTRMRSGGAIVNISSLAGIQGTDKIPGLWAYTASKFAVTGLSEGLAVEGKELNIRVNCIAPGATDTEMLRQAAPGFKARAMPDDIAKIAYYLCDSDQSGILTGTTIPVFSNS